MLIILQKEIFLGMPSGVQSDRGRRCLDGITKNIAKDFTNLGKLINILRENWQYFVWRCGLSCDTIHPLSLHNILGRDRIYEMSLLRIFREQGD